MAYVKTNWVDNTTPIDKTNLNKIEQGIYDNSLVTEAIADKLNPTDTETYKTAELTEGQITDVIGVNDIVIKGQTSQDGEPTPSSPVDVNVVSGSNVINTSNKNLLSLTNGTYSYNNVKAIVNKGIITINGTPSSTPTLLQISLTQPIKLKQNDSIKINVNNLNGIGTSSNYVSFRLLGTVNGVSNDNITDIVCTNANANKTFTATNDTIINQVAIRGNTNVTFNNFVIKPQIELGTTTTTYEPHQNKELPLDLPVENLLNLTNGTYSNNGVEAIVNNGKITLNGTASANSFIDVPISLTLIANNAYAIGIGNNEKIGGTASQAYSCIRLRTSGGDDGETDVLFNLQYNSKIVTKTNTTTYSNFRIRTSTGLTYRNFIIKPQLEQGSKANAYTPYGADPIELCKIGNYQDCFYKDGSKWYLHKEIGKIVFDGSSDESFSYSSGNIVFYTDTITSLVKHNSTLICTLFKSIANGTGYANMKNGEIKLDGTSSGRIILKFTDYTNVTDFKTWLASNNVTLYYLLNTATDTEITDTTLLSQLEAIYNAPLYEQTNITQINNDLAMILDITACKDNINGIKAFIRK